MRVSTASLRGIGWAALLALCCAALFGLSLKVNALRSEVRQAENRVLALRRETMYLETEYETRANQQQLAAWNAVDFGYQAPNAGQYFENVRQLAALGKVAGPEAPEPIRVAAAPSETSALPTMVSPLTGKPLTDEDEPEADQPIDHDEAAANLAERLSKPAAPAHASESEPAKSEAAKEEPAKRVLARVEKRP